MLGVLSLLFFFIDDSNAIRGNCVGSCAKPSIGSKGQTKSQDSKQNVSNRGSKYTGAENNVPESADPVESRSDPSEKAGNEANTVKKRRRMKYTARTGSISIPQSAIQRIGVVATIAFFVVTFLVSVAIMFNSFF